MRRILATLAGLTLAAGLATAPAYANDTQAQEQAVASQESQFNGTTASVMLGGLLVVGAVATSSVRSAAREENRNR